MHFSIVTILWLLFGTEHYYYYYYFYKSLMRLHETLYKIYIPIHLYKCTAVSPRL